MSGGEQETLISRTIYHIETPEELERFAPQYIPEKFSQEEIKFLKPFFSNFDKQVFVMSGLPEEVVGSLMAKYSRSTDSMRRMFIRDFVSPIIHPEKLDRWTNLSEEEKNKLLEDKRNFTNFVKYLNKSGGIEKAINIEKARNFFEKWLAGFGDDSIAELGNAHVCLEGISNIASNAIETKRIGISPLEKSSRYVPFTDKDATGNYRYVVPGEIKGTALEAEYRASMDELFALNAELQGTYIQYIKSKYPRGEDEPESAFNSSRRSKMFDDLRDLLPFATQTNVALNGNARAFEDLMDTMLASEIGEVRFLGNSMLQELQKAIPSLVKRVTDERGRQVQEYKKKVNTINKEISKSFPLEAEEHSEHKGYSVKLVDSTPNPELRIIAAAVFKENHNLSVREIMKKVFCLGYREKEEILAKLLSARKLGNPEADRSVVRVRKVPRVFEFAHYTFEIVGRGGDYRDLHRHRILSEVRQPFSSELGYNLEKDVTDSPFAADIRNVLEKAGEFQKKMESISPEVAQYAVPYAYLQRWLVKMSAREIYYMAELRTGPQGRPHYRGIVQEMARQAIGKDEMVFQGMMVDWNNYDIARRESEKWTANRLKELDKK